MILIILISRWEIDRRRSWWDDPWGRCRWWWSDQLWGIRENDDGEIVPDYQKISEKDLSGVLTKAIQELSAKVTALENA